MSDNTLNRLRLPHVQSKKISKLSTQPRSSWIGIFSIFLFLQMKKKMNRRVQKITHYDFWKTSQLKWTCKEKHYSNWPLSGVLFLPFLGSESACLNRKYAYSYFCFDDNIAKDGIPLNFNRVGPIEKRQVYVWIWRWILPENSDWNELTETDKVKLPKWKCRTRVNFEVRISPSTQLYTLSWWKWLKHDLLVWIKAAL